MENTSGQGKLAAVPPEIDRWNWGAFLLNWIWGIGNDTFIALLMFVPIVNIVMPFVLGAKGSAWAWKNRKWDGVEHFKSVQRKWAIWAIVVCVVFIGLCVSGVFVAFVAVQNSEAYQIGVSKVQANQEAIAELGMPITTGFPMGSIEISGASGTANISFAVEGPKSKGTVFVDAVKDLGQWKAKRIVLEIEKSGKRINLNN
jgi:hypothetical protein